MSCAALSVCPLAKDTRSPIPPLPHATARCAPCPGNRPVACGDGPGLLSFPQERCIYRPCMPLKKACIQCHSSDDEERGCVVSWRGGPCRPRVRWPMATGQLMIGSTSTPAGTFPSLKPPRKTEQKPCLDSKFFHSLYYIKSLTHAWSIKCK